MTKDKRHEVIGYADEYFTKKQYRDALAALNVPDDPAAARKQFIEYNMARAEAIEAERRLEKAIQSL